MLSGVACPRIFCPEIRYLGRFGERLPFRDQFRGQYMRVPSSGDSICNLRDYYSRRPVNAAILTL